MSAPVTATTASSDFRSTLHHFTGLPLIGFAATGHRRLATRSHTAGVKTDLSCFAVGCVHVPRPLRRRVPECFTSKTFTPSMAFAREIGARLPLGPCSRRGNLTTRQTSLNAADRTLARPPKGLCHDASTVGSPLPSATSYRAAWPLPGPDSHRQVHDDLSGHTPLQFPGQPSDRSTPLTPGGSSTPAPDSQAPSMAFAL